MSQQITDRFSFSLLFIGAALMCPHFAWAEGETAPRVRVVTEKRSAAGNQVPSWQSSGKSSWRTYITATIFWCGEQPTERNPTPNDKSSWDVNWRENFGGYDDPDPKSRIADHARMDFRPKGFRPNLNTFYIALPYNDVRPGNLHKPEAPRVIPWFKKLRPKPGRTVLKGKWVQIFVDGVSCYAQWEDCGPWVTDDYAYVFGGQRPKAWQNGAAGIDLSPAIRDFLRIKSGAKVHWRFVEDHHVPNGPWKKYGEHPAAQIPVDEAEQKDLERIRQMRIRRDAEQQKKPLNELRRSQ